MKTITSTVLLLSLTLGIMAQGKKVTYADKKQVEQFFKTKTMIVMDADQLLGYNIEVTNAVKKCWTVTPYEIISSEKFDEIRRDPAHSFLFLSKVELDKDEEEVYYLYMNLVMGANVDDITDMPEFLSLPLAYTGVDEDAYADKLPLMVRFAQIHVNNLKTAKNLRNAYNLKNYNRGSDILTQKVLLVKESDLSEEVNTIEKIKAVYSGEVRIVRSEEIVEAIETKAANTAILHQIGPGEEDNSGRSYREIFGTDDADLYYYNNQTITSRRPAGMLVRDFRLISGKLF